MLRRDFEAILARLCLLAVALMGVSPSQGLVLCFEPSGRVALEIPGASSTCEPREGSCCADGETEKVVLRSSCCDCTDVTIASANEATVVRPASDLRQLEAPAAMGLLTWVPEVLGVPRERPMWGDAPPRPPGILAHVRAIELRL